MFGFAPWIVYWTLVGNVPVAAAGWVALVIALVAFALGRATAKSEPTLEIGAVATFLVVTVLTFALDESVTQKWILPLSYAGIFLVTLVGLVIGKPFAREFAAAEQPDDVVRTEMFAGVVRALALVWVSTFAAMTVSSVIPPLADPKASMLDRTAPVSFVCYWVIPFALLGAAAIASRFLPGRMLAGIGDVARETSFVAYDEATIDELYYLAQEHANREVGVDKEAYAVKVGGMGVPLTGDEGRKSWPSTYKVRDKK
jgi:hypothetical protein